MKDDQRVALTKRLLQEGLFQLLEEKDIDHIRVSELCLVSGINRATFYRHYEQPRDILRELRYSIIRDVQALAEKDKAETNLQKWLEDICQYFYEHAALLGILFKTRTDDEFVQAIQAIYAQRFDELHNSSIGRRQDGDSLKLTAYCYAGGFYYVLRQWILEPVCKTPQEVAAILYRFFAGNITVL